MAFRFYVYVFEISLLYYISSFVFCNETPSIDSVQIMNETFFTDKESTLVKLTLQLSGNNFHENMKIRPSFSKAEYGTECLEDEMASLESFEYPYNGFGNSTFSVISVTFAYNSDSPFTDISLCILNLSRSNSENEISNDTSVSKWLNSGKSFAFRTKSLIDAENKNLFSDETVTPKM